MLSLTSLRSRREERRFKEVIWGINKYILVYRKVFFLICFLYLLGSQEAQLYTLRTAKALAMTALDVIFKPELLEGIREEFKLKLQEEQLLNTPA